MKFSDKMDNLTSAIFTELELKKSELIASGKEVFDFSVGTPDIPPSKALMETLNYYVTKPEFYKYAIKDTEELTDAVIQWYRTRYNVDLNVNEVTSLLGSQSGFDQVCMALVNPGDIVLTQDPGYPIFKIGAVLASAKIHTMPLKKENNFLIDFDAIDTSVAEKAKLMIVSYPNNPTAATADRDFYMKLVAFAKKYDIAVLHDNAYSELVFDGGHGSSFLEIPGAMDVGIEFNSLSKTYSIPGCRIAFAVGNNEIIKSLKTIKSHVDYGMFLPFQKVAIEALTGSQEYADYVRNLYERRRDLLIKGLNSAGWIVDKTPATMFVWAKIPDNYDNSMKFTMDLLLETGVIVVPGSSFGKLGEGFVRIALVQDEYKILRAIEKIKAFINKI